MGKLVTLDHVARELGISKSVVSRAINGRYGVSDETRSKVKLTALRMGYRFSMPTEKEKGRTESVSLVVERHDVADLEFWTKVIHSVEKNLNQKGISVFLSIHEPDDEDTVPLSIQQMKTSGVVFLGLVPVKLVLNIASTGMPVVWADSNYPSLKVDQVMSNNYSGCFDAAEFLIRRGHRKIGFVGSTSYSFSFSERFRGFSDCLTQNGIVDPLRYSIIDAHDSVDVPFSLKRFRLNLQSGDLPSAFVCGNDVTAIIICDILRQFGLRIPDDISIIGFDNIQKCQWVSPRLSSVDFSKDQMGERLVGLLLNRIENKDRSTELVLLAAEVVRRESVRDISNTSCENH